MEKLIELLNEYQKENKRQIFYSYNKDLDFFECWSVSWIETYWDSTCNIMSKNFWFIERLVKNDKIDFDKCWICYEINSTYDHYNLEERQDLWLIMLLSIQDNPIEFLCSVLK